jgi:hypothetical protein
LCFQERFDRPAVTAPSTAHVHDVFGEHLFLVDRQRPAHAVVMKGAGTAVGRDVEAGEVTARIAAIPGVGHASHATGRPVSDRAQVVAPPPISTVVCTNLKSL